MTKNIEGVEIIEFELDRFVLHLHGGFSFFLVQTPRGRLARPREETLHHS